MKEAVKRRMEDLPMSEFTGPRSCAVCPKPATKQCFRLDPKFGLNIGSRRFACDDHLDVEVLWPVVRAPEMGSLPERKRGYNADKGDMTEMYFGIIREFGGEAPAIVKSDPPSERKKVWLKPYAWDFMNAPVVQPRHRLHRRRTGLVKRQWVKYRKAEGLARGVR